MLHHMLVMVLCLALSGWIGIIYYNYCLIRSTGIFVSRYNHLIHGNGPGSAQSSKRVPLCVRLQCTCIASRVSGLNKYKFISNGFKFISCHI